MRWAAILCLAAGPAWALDAPDGCEPYLTVQDRSCEVDVFFRCDGADGARVRVQNYNADGLNVVEEVSPDWSLFFSVHPAGRSGVVVRNEPASEASFADLMASGESRFDYPVDYYVRGPVPFKTRLVGTFQLIGSETEIAGRVFRDVELRVRADLPEPIFSVETIQKGFFNGELNVFLEGPGSHRFRDRVAEIKRYPVDLIQPGEGGFLNVEPRHGCDLRDAGWHAP